MKVVFVSRKHGGSRSVRSVELGRWSRALLSLCCLGLPLGIAGGGFLLGQQNAVDNLHSEALEGMQDDLEQQNAELASLKAQAESQIQALTVNFAELQARLTRLDALGEHLTAMAGLEDGEFDFSQPAGVGGPIGGEFNVEYNTSDLLSELGLFQARLSDREQQLDILESLLTNRKLDEQAVVSGRPVEKGWISSYYGRRTDPFNGKPAFHNGIDFAGKPGSNILAVAGGVVTWAGDKSGYGNLVEITHEDGFVTRYGHNKETLVNPGDLVRKGEVIAKMGSTGRSTGSHVHFEVYKNGRSVDPASYVRRTYR
ncbi:peptidoglycan DD-metalloendopeptidase family protein [Haliea sp. E17]|uniref:peptidoglycan DD-metalloendopeptidase family protein n=1 Tax=Haliea sp. E17 TaxID=3401576 RepID=UPI003AAD4966